jgi:hypothetical protein
MGNAAIVLQPFIKDVRLIFEDCKNGQVRFWCIHVFFHFIHINTTVHRAVATPRTSCHSLEDSSW